MKFLNKKFGRFPLGVWFAIVALVLILLAWIMQAYSVINWEGAVKMGFQTESFTGDAVERAIANMERGVATADILWALPVWIVAFIGILRKKFIGFVAGMMEFAICVYFPLIYTFRRGTGMAIVMFILILWAIPSLLGIAGLWSNREYFT